MRESYLIFADIPIIKYHFNTCPHCIKLIDPYFTCFDTKVCRMQKYEYLVVRYLRKMWCLFEPST